MSEVETGQVAVKNNFTRQEIAVSFEEIKTDFASVFKQLGSDRP